MFINANATHYITEKEDCRYHSFLIPPEMLGFFEGSVMQEKHVERILFNPAISSRIFSPERRKTRKRWSISGALTLFILAMTGTASGSMRFLSVLRVSGWKLRNF